jgi:hypothetical protein
MKDDIKESIQNYKYNKFDHLAPEGFVLIPEGMLEDLKEFDNWKEWKNNPDFHQILKEKNINKLINQ